MSKGPAKIHRTRRDLFRALLGSDAAAEAKAKEPTEDTAAPGPSAEAAPAQTAPQPAPRRKGVRPKSIPSVRS
jgi:hypothetical protein